MTVEDLIKRLENTGGGVGSLLRDWFEKYKKSCRKGSETVSSAPSASALEEYMKSTLYETALYQKLHGFFCGLYAAGYVTDEELTDLETDALLQKKA